MPHTLHTRIYKLKRVFVCCVLCVHYCANRNLSGPRVGTHKPYNMAANGLFFSLFSNEELRENRNEKSWRGGGGEVRDETMVIFVRDRVAAAEGGQAMKTEQERERERKTETEH